MAHKASFDENGKVTWTEVPPAPVDHSRLQKAMFLDRPDLWPPPKHRKRARPAKKPDQIALFEISEERS